MKVIYKYIIPPEGITISMPSGSELLTVDGQGGEIRQAGSKSSGFLSQLVVDIRRPGVHYDPGHLMISGP